MDNAYLIDDSQHEEPDRGYKESYACLVIQCQDDENKGKEGQNQVIDEWIQRHAEGVLRCFLWFSAAIFQMAQDHHGPDEDEAEGRNAGDENEYTFRHDVIQNDRDEDDGGRKKGGLGWHMAFCKLLHRSRSVTLLRKGENHAAGAENTTVAGRSRSGENDKVDDAGSGGNSHRCEYLNERAFVRAYRVPGIDAHDDAKSADIEDDDADRDVIDSLWNHALRVFGFTSCEADQLNACEGEYGHLEGEHEATEPIREPASVIPEIGEARYVDVRGEAA